jgi:hypothetical protein
MAALVWDEKDDIYRANGYRIDRVRDEGAPWLLTLERVRWPRFVRQARRDGHRFWSLRSACAAALHMEVVRVRCAKLTRHIVLAVLLLLTAGVLYAVMTLASEPTRVEWFAGSLVVVGIAWSEALSAFMIATSGGWDHGYEVPTLTWIDRGVTRAIIWLTSPGKLAPVEAAHGPVRVLSLD